MPLALHIFSAGLRGCVSWLMSRVDQRRGHAGAVAMPSFCFLRSVAICSSPGVGESSAKGVYLWDTERKAWGREV